MCYITYFFTRNNNLKLISIKYEFYLAMQYSHAVRHDKKYPEWRKN